MKPSTPDRDEAAPSKSRDDEGYMHGIATLDISKLESAQHNSDYWMRGALDHFKNGMPDEAMVCAANAVNPWKNAAFHFARECNAPVSEQQHSEPVDSLNYFVRESNRIEGIQRDPTQDELTATLQFVALSKTPTISDLVDLVKVYQPDAKPRFVQGLDVRVGKHIPPRGGPDVQASLKRLLEDIDAGKHTPFSAHQAYETLHPFTDGNGRSGRVLWLWMVGGHAPLGFLHGWYYQSLSAERNST